MSEAPRYMDFMSDSSDAVLTAQAATPHFVEHATVMPTPHEDNWHGLWAIDADGGHEEFYGDKDDVIAWARERSASILIWSEALQNLEPLPFPA